MSEKIRSNIDVPRILRQFEKSFNKARRRVKIQIEKDSTPYVPFVDGDLSRSARASTTTDDPYLVWNAPQAHYLYEGRLMVGASGSSWAKRNERKKYKVPPTELRYQKSGHPNAGAKWFEEAKKRRLEMWLKVYSKGAKR